MLDLRKYRSLFYDYIAQEQGSMVCEHQIQCVCVCQCVSTVSHDQIRQQIAFESSNLNQIKDYTHTQREAVNLKANWVFFTHFCSFIIQELVSTTQHNWKNPCGLMSHVLTYYTDMQLGWFHIQKLNSGLGLLTHTSLITM